MENKVLIRPLRGCALWWGRIIQGATVGRFGGETRPQNHLLKRVDVVIGTVYLVMWVHKFGAKAKLCGGIAKTLSLDPRVPAPLPSPS